MTDYNLFADIWNSFRSSTDWVKALFILVIPLTVFAFRGGRTRRHKIPIYLVGEPPYQLLRKKEAEDKLRALLAEPDVIAEMNRRALVGVWGPLWPLVKHFYPKAWRE